MFSFTLGADLGAMAGGGAVADNIFIRERDDPSPPGQKLPFFHADLNFALTGFTGSARFGFLGVTTKNGTVNATPAFDIRLNDPNMDNKLTIKEIVDTVLANPLDLLTTSLGGTGSASFQLSASMGRFSIPASSDTEVTISVPDFSQPENVIVTLPSTAIFDDIANFNNMDAASFASLFGRISNFLDSVRNTRLAELDIPFTDANVGDLLDLQDAFADLVLFEDGGSETTDSKILLNDMAMALASAGLAGRIRA